MKLIKTTDTCVGMQW